jgi:hypothetical protein
LKKCRTGPSRDFFFGKIPADSLQLMGGGKKNQGNIRRKKGKKPFDFIWLAGCKNIRQRRFALNG